MRYRTIVADPPWPYESDGQHLPRPRVSRPNSWDSPRWGPGVRAARYQTMSIANLCAISCPSEANAHLYLWTTNSFMDEAHDVARAWGFKPKTILTWTKMKHDGSGVSGKVGYYFRGATEHVLFCVRGSLPLSTTEALPTGWLWPRLPHSVKPDAFFDLVEKASPGPYLEMFSRRARFGWDTWGDEALHGTEAKPALGL